MLIEIVDESTPETEMRIKSRGLQISAICKILQEKRNEKIEHVKKYGGDLDKIQEFDRIETSLSLFAMDNDKFERIANLVLR